jgi:hypothetical protein
MFKDLDLQSVVNFDSAPAAAKELIQNGDFANGNFHAWTLFTTQNGTLGYGHDPKVTLFDVTGSGAQNAAEFQVGQVGDVGTEEGGGLEQTIATKAGLLDFSADIAAYTSKHVNLEGGTFSVLLDGVVEDTMTFGIMARHVVDRGQLSFETSVSAGPHTIEILVTRDYTDGPKRGYSPFEYVTNISATQPKTPGVHAFAAAAAAFGAPGAAIGVHTGGVNAPIHALALPHVQRY